MVPEDANSDCGNGVILMKPCENENDMVALNDFMLIVSLCLSKYIYMIVFFVFDQLSWLICLN